MKLLLCRACQDVLKLQESVSQHSARWCRCGKSGGRYLDDSNAEYWGKDALLLGFDNNSLAEAVHGGIWKEDVTFGPRFTAFIIPSNAMAIHKTRTPRKR